MKTRIVTAVGTALFLLAAMGAFAADPNANHSAIGSWILNPAKSNFQNTPMPRMQRLRIMTDDGKMLSWSMTGAGTDGKAFHEEYEGPIDGAFHPVKGSGDASAIAYTRNNAVTSWTVKDKDGAVVETASGSVSADGHTLTIKGRRKTPQGQSEFTSVYDRVK